MFEQDCLLRRLLRAMPHMSEAALQEATTMLLLLLYDTEFKFECTTHLLEYYGGMLAHIVHSNTPRHPLITSLDRLTVQLFNSEEVTTRCVVEVWV